MVDATTVVEGFVPSTAPSAEPSLSGVASYLLGNRVDREDYFNISIRSDANEVENASVNYIDYAIGNRYIDKVEAKFKPTNGVPFYMVAGKSTNAIADQYHQITSWDLGTRKPTYHFIKRFGALIPTVAYGCPMNELSGTFRKKDGWIFTMSGKGRKPDDLTSFTPETPTMPTHTSNTNSADSFDQCPYVKWGTSGSLKSFSIVDFVEFKVGHGFLTPTFDDNGYHKEITEMGNLITTFTIQVRGTTSDVVALKADCANKTGRSIEVYGSKSANSNHYFNIETASDNTAKCVALDYAHVLGNVVSITATIVVPNFYVEVQDYVDDTLYEVPT